MTDKEPTQEQIKEFWEWCGVEFYANDNRVWARTPSGGAVDQTWRLYKCKCGHTSAKHLHQPLCPCLRGTERE